MSAALELPTMLCVDDDPTVVNQLRILFRGLFKVTTLTDPTAAVSMLCAGSKFDVVIADQQMPRMLGVEVLDIAREVAPLAGRILLTGFCESEVVVDSVNRADVNWYIPKPWNPEDIRSKAALAARRSLLARDEAPIPKYPPVHAAKELRAAQTTDAQKMSAASAVFIGLSDCEKLVRDALPTNTKCAFVNRFEDALTLIERERSIPDIVVVAINVQSEEDRSNLERLKANFPAVVLVIVCDTSFANATIKLVNSARPFRFLAAPIGHKLLLRALEAAIERSRAMRQEPNLVLAQIPAETNASQRSPIGKRIRSIFDAFKGRFLNRT